MKKYRNKFQKWSKTFVCHKGKEKLHKNPNIYYKELKIIIKLPYMDTWYTTSLYER